MRGLTSRLRDGKRFLRMRARRRPLMPRVAVALCLGITAPLLLMAALRGGVAGLEGFPGRSASSLAHDSLEKLAAALSDIPSRLPLWSPITPARASAPRSAASADQVTVLAKVQSVDAVAFSQFISPLEAGHPEGRYSLDMAPGLNQTFSESRDGQYALPPLRTLVWLAPPPSSQNAASLGTGSFSRTTTPLGPRGRPRAERPGSVVQGASSGSGAMSVTGSQEPWHPADRLGGSLDRAGELVATIPGLQLKRVIVFQGYSSNAVPRLSGVPAAAGQLGYDVDIGTTATFIWRHLRPRSVLSIEYAPSAIRRLRTPEWNSADHVVSVIQRRALSPRWALDVSGRAANRGLEQFFFRPAVLREVEDPPLDIEDLTAAAANGDLTSEELAAVLTGSPLIDEPGRGELDLNRVLSYQVAATASYRHSRRLSMRWKAATSGYEAGSGPREDSPSGRRLLQRTRTAVAESELEYRVSPRIRAGATMVLRRNRSNLQRGNYASAVGTVRRRLGRRWSVGVEGGGGAARLSSTILSPHPANYAAADVQPTWVAGGELEYRGRAHALTLSAGRRVGDPVGLGARTSVSGRVGWHWRRPGSDWGLRGGADLFYSRLDGFDQAIQSRLVRFGWVRRVGRHNALVTEYSYGAYSAPFTGVLTSLSRHRVQVSFEWRPKESRQ